MTTTLGYGGLGNQIIRNLAVSIIAEKYNLHVTYFNKDLIEKLGVTLFCGSNTYERTEILNDANYFSLYNSGNIEYNLYPNYDFFQTKEVSNLLYDYLRKDTIQSGIMEKNPFKHRYNENNDLVIHIRLTDVAYMNPGIDYYLNTIKKIQFDNLYITTDEPTHAIVQTLTTTYPNATVINYDEINTFHFATTCKHVILSHGSFSALIGLLSFFSTVYYPAYIYPGYIDYGQNIWFGDMFTTHNWIGCSF